ncbi:HlyD family secretion protein [Photobacterium sp. S4TG1]|uniref:HlyD family secretion protein n=1 Tax=Photobacterium sp. S4TG1 TaxID=3114587 RepID=UPI002E1877EA|nr:HlyD family secretion protein [Photobacterium sp. S4TG1]
MKKITTTIFIILIALFLIALKYHYYINNPWTRDAIVRSNIIEITPKVTGEIIALYVNNNTEVKKGDLLFKIDPRIFEVELDKNKANLYKEEINLKREKDIYVRGLKLYNRLPNSISKIELYQQKNAVKLAQAKVKMATSLLNESKLELSFTKVIAPTDGYITNININVGSQVVSNQPVFPLIDINSFWIEGFFKETNIKNISIGDKTTVTLMAYDNKPLIGYVESIGYGIAYKNGSTGTALLPNVSPTFQWIRLAQRIPVRVRLNIIPKDVKFIIGASASVTIHNENSPISFLTLFKELLCI